LGIALGKPAYVTKIIPEENVVVLGEVEDLMRNGMYVAQVNSMKYSSIPAGLESTTQVRYNDPGTLSELYPEGGQIRVEFLANVRGIAPGQSAVFYEGDDVVGGGIIHKSL
jgi:tRNA-specific 2-thiouridylase